MNVKIKFKTLDTLKVLMYDISNVEVLADEFLIRKININAFTLDEINRLANTTGVTINIHDENTMGMYIHKSFCSVEFMSSEEDRTKYLTNEIDKLSSELNKIINK